MTEKEIRAILKQETEIPETVDRAVEMLLKELVDGRDKGQRRTKETYTGQKRPEEIYTEKRNTAEKTETVRKSGKKSGRKMLRYLLPAAAVLVGATAVAAAGYSFLHRNLEEQGLSAGEADQLIITSLVSDTENLEDAEYNGVKPEEKKWNAPMLTVEEAYFDGSSLHFIANPSEEAKAFELSCRDHGTVGGADAMASVTKIEGEEKYYGNIEIPDADQAQEIFADASEVEVSLTLLAHPAYEGRIYYSWHDSEAYGKLFDIGAFKDSDGNSFYVLPEDDVNRGYTPQQLTITVPLTEEARTIIEKYRSEGKLQNENSYTGLDRENGTDTEKMESTGEEAGADGGKQQATASEISGSDETLSAENGQTEQTSSGISEAALEETLKNAEWIGDTSGATKGTLVKKDFTSEELQQIFSAQNGWETWGEDGNSWKAAGAPLYLSKDADGRIGFSAEDKGDDAEAEYEKEDISWVTDQILPAFGLDAAVSEDSRFSGNGDDTKVYQIKYQLEGLPVANLSQHLCNGNMSVTDGEVTSLFFSSPLTVQTQEEASLLSADEILSAAKKCLLTEQDLETCTDVREIRLEYYVDETADGIIYRPVWNFRGPVSFGGEEKIMEDLFYIDAETGALVRTLWGY